ncbi:hypothetical protein HMI54_003982, partial [Coelomomyces lativittatus]
MFSLYQASFHCCSYFSLSQCYFPLQPFRLYEYISKKTWINLLRTYLVALAPTKPYFEENLRSNTDLPRLCEEFCEFPPGYCRLVPANFRIELGNPPWRLTKFLSHHILVPWSSFSGTFSFPYFRIVH